MVWRRKKISLYNEILILNIEEAFVTDWLPTFLGDPWTPGDPTCFLSGVFWTEGIPPTGGGGVPCCKYCCWRSRNCCSSSATTSKSRDDAPTWNHDRKGKKKLALISFLTKLYLYLSHDWSCNDICVILVWFNAVHVLVEDCYFFLVVPTGWTTKQLKEKKINWFVRGKFSRHFGSCLKLTWIRHPSPRLRLAFWKGIHRSGGLDICRGHHSSCPPWRTCRREPRRSPGRTSGWTAGWSRSVPPCSRSHAPSRPCNPSARK